MIAHANAIEQISSGYSLLLSQSTISLWNLLDTFIRDFLAAWLGHIDQTLASEQVRRIKISLAEFLLMYPEEQYSYIVEQLFMDRAIATKTGVETFEPVLALFSLSGEIDQRTKRKPIELQQIRNVLVHRSEIADRRLVSSCPWLNLNVGDRVTIDRRAFESYSASANSYFLKLIGRIEKYFDLKE
jgi:hypothetical protein